MAKIDHRVAPLHQLPPASVQLSTVNEEYFFIPKKISTKSQKLHAFGASPTNLEVGRNCSTYFVYRQTHNFAIAIANQIMIMGKDLPNTMFHQTWKNWDPEARN